MTAVRPPACPMCGALAAPRDHACRRCGAPLAGRPAAGRRAGGPGRLRTALAALVAARYLPFLAAGELGWPRPGRRRG
jgi:hypothetical protein